MANKYNIPALAKARKDCLLSGDVKALDYRGIAALAGVTVEANGNSPRDFFYVSVRHKVVSTLWTEELAAADAAREAVIRSKLTTAEEEWFDGMVGQILFAPREVG